MRVVDRQAGLNDPTAVVVALASAGTVVVVIPDDAHRLEVVNVVQVVELLPVAVCNRSRRIGHDVVGSEYLRVWQVVFGDMGDELQRGPRGAVGYARMVLRIGTGRAAVGSCELVQSIAFVDLVHEVVGKVGEASVRKQPIVGASDQELVESRAGH